MKKPVVSIVIPALNEEKYLPELLKSVRAQDFQEYEIIVADKRSKDRTREIAKRFGCKIVAGGLPAKARNNGAAAAKGEWILFLDADVILPENFLAELVAACRKEKFVVATFLFVPLGGRIIDRVLHAGAFWIVKMMKYIKPMAPGFCIVVRKDVHKKMGGFDETLRMCEDHAYVHAAAKRGTFKVLSSPYVAVSVRRLDKEGRMGIMKKYAQTSWNYVVGRVEANNRVRYEFGKYGKGK